jgi:hypothetical protein
MPENFMRHPAEYALENLAEAKRAHNDGISRERFGFRQ